MNILKEISANLGLTLTDKTVDVSFIANCEFWETKYKGIYLTDYNIDWDYKQIKSANLLKTKGCVALFGKGKSMIFSKDLLTDTEFMNKEIDNFKNNVNN